MSLNDFFCAMAYSYDVYHEYDNYYKEWNHPPESKDNPLSEEEVLFAIYETIESVEESKKAQQSLPAKQNVTELNYEEAKILRMQDLERCALEFLRVVNDRGILRVWNGSAYVSMTPNTFAREVRKVLPEYLQDKIPSYKSFTETFQYMKVNDSLTDMFTEECVEDTKKMISFNNGVIMAGKKELLPHNPDYPVYFTVEADYDPFDKDTSVMDSLIDMASNNDKSVKRLFYEVLGYIISGNSSVKKFFVFATAPDSGKSIIGEFIGRLIGDENTSNIEMHNLGEKFVSGTVSGKVLNYNMDLLASPVAPEAVQQMKQYTGDPRTNSEVKFSQSESVYHHCKFLFATNHPIKLKEDDDAFYNRLVLVPFIRSVEECDKDYNLGKKLWNSRNAIVTKAAKAYRRLCENNFVFTKCRLADDMIDSWRNRPADYRLRKFIDDKCEIQREDKSIFTPTEELFRAFQQYWEIRGYKITDDDKIPFSRQLHEGARLTSGKKRQKGYASPVNGYFGIRLKDNEVSMPAGNLEF